MKSVAIDFASTKDAALYFDHIVPIGFLQMDDTIEYDELLKILLPQNATKLVQKVQEVLFNCARIDGTETWDRMVPDTEHKGSVRIIYNEKKRKEVRARYGNSVENLISEFKLNGSVFTFDQLANIDNATNLNELRLTLSGINLIDLSIVPWEHILEFRKDAQSQRKLKRLLKFMSNEYSGKNVEYIQDDLFERIEDYNNVASDWGFETRSKALTALLSSKALATAGTAAFAAGVLGSGEMMTAALASGTLIEIGKQSLYFESRKRGLQVIRRDSPISYLLNAKTKLEVQ